MSSKGEPLSWITLERYALGELPEHERADVEARLAQSETARAILAAIESDPSEAPAVPEITGAATGGRAGERAGIPISLAGARRKTSRVWTFASAGLAAAAALLLWRGLPARPNDVAYDGVKGHDFALQLISDQSGPAARTFREGERFKVEVSCPASFTGTLRILIFQGAERFEPLTAHTLRCANRVLFPGAFTLDGGEPAEVCLYAGSASTPAREADGLVCTRLTPNP